MPDISVTEFGFAEPFEGQWTSLAPALWDLRRADYLQNYLDQILLSIHEDKVRLIRCNVRDGSAKLMVDRLT